jgi:DNA-binding Lrp family transcriptional regulator
MPLKAYILIALDPAKTREAFKALRTQRTKEIKAVELISGRYDIIMTVQTVNMKSLGTLINEKIRTVDGILKTETLITLEA